MKTELEYKQCEDYYKEIIDNLTKKYEKQIEDLKYELRKLR